MIDMPSGSQDRLSFRYASGPRLRHILASLDAEANYLLMTSFRNRDLDTGKLRTRQDNDIWFHMLPHALRSDLQTTKITAYWLLGHWTEYVPDQARGWTFEQCQLQDLPHADYFEYGWLFIPYSNSLSAAQWLAGAVAQAKQFDQESFIIRLDGVATIRSQRGEQLEVLASNEESERCWTNLARDRSDCLNLEPSSRALQDTGSSYRIRRQGLPAKASFS